MINRKWILLVCMVLANCNGLARSENEEYSFSGACQDDLDTTLDLVTDVNNLQVIDVESDGVLGNEYSFETVTSHHWKTVRTYEGYDAYGYAQDDGVYGVDSILTSFLTRWLYLYGNYSEDQWIFVKVDMTQIVDASSDYAYDSYPVEVVILQEDSSGSFDPEECRIPSDCDYTNDPVNYTVGTYELQEIEGGYSLSLAATADSSAERYPSDLDISFDFTVDAVDVEITYPNYSFSCNWISRYAYQENVSDCPDGFVQDSREDEGSNHYLECGQCELSLDGTVIADGNDALDHLNETDWLVTDCDASSNSAIFSASVE